MFPMQRLIALFLVLAGCLGAQMFGTAVSPTSDPPPTAVVQQGFYDASGTFQYLCRARQANVTNTWGVGNGLTSIVVSSNVATVTFSQAPGMYVGLRFTISGSTVSALNGTYKVTGISSATVTFATSGVSDGTYNNAALVVLTTWPLLTAPVWAISVSHYDTSNRWDGGYWAGVDTSYSVKCSDRANY